MTTLALIGWIALAIILIIGLIRVIVKPYQGFLDMFMDFLLIDLLFDLIGVVFENIGDLFD